MSQPDSLHNNHFALLSYHRCYSGTEDTFFELIIEYFLYMSLHIRRERLHLQRSINAQTGDNAFRILNKTFLFMLHVIRRNSSLVVDSFGCGPSALGSIFSSCASFCFLPLKNSDCNATKKPAHSVFIMRGQTIDHFQNKPLSKSAKLLVLGCDDSHHRCFENKLCLLLLVTKNNQACVNSCPEIHDLAINDHSIFVRPLPSRIYCPTIRW